MILYVDYEHPSTYRHEFNDPLMAARARITHRLHDLTGQPCLLLRYPFVTPDLIARHDISAVFISGNGAKPDAYDPDDLQGLRTVVQSMDVPTFGFCGGMQFIATAFGVELERMGRVPAGVDDPHPEYEPGWVTELSYEPVRLVADHPVVAGLPTKPVFRHAHAWQIARVPNGFVRLAETDRCPIQLIAHTDAPIAGSQFHPEYWTDEAPDGRTLLEGFCRWVGLLR